MKAVKHFQSYLYGRPFLIRTDHGALRWLTNFGNLEGQLARWMEYLSSYDYTIQHRPGRHHLNADSLSRRPCENCSYCERQEGRQVEQNLLDQIISISEECPSSNGPKIRLVKPAEDSETFTLPVKTPKELKQAQSDDPILSKFLEVKISGIRPKWEEISHLSPEFKKSLGSVG